MISAICEVYRWSAAKSSFKAISMLPSEGKHGALAIRTSICFGSRGLRTPLVIVNLIKTISAGGAKNLALFASSFYQNRPITQKRISVTIMIGKLRQWSLTQASYFGAAVVVVLGNPGYLPKIGPAPLRVAPVIHVDTNAPVRFDLPAPKVDNTEPPKTYPLVAPPKTPDPDTNAPVVPLVSTPVTNVLAPASAPSPAT